MWLSWRHSSPFSICRYASDWRLLAVMDSPQNEGVDYYQAQALTATTCKECHLIITAADGFKYWLGDVRDGKLNSFYWPSIWVTLQRGSGFWVTDLPGVCGNPYAHARSAHSQSQVVCVYWFVLLSQYVELRSWHGYLSTGLLVSLSKYSFSEERRISDQIQLIYLFVCLVSSTSTWIEFIKISGWSAD